MFRRFVTWLARFLESTGLVEQQTPERIPRIAYLDEHGAQQVGNIVGPVGLYLDVRPVGDSSLMARLLSAEQAVDPDLFWQQWKAWGGELYYDDGTPFDPAK